ncbi:HdeD family acid-resistance protein [Isoptericola aurantiacus]|uniref:HdeD family acid-resistance protein n=1 Tax=Isoptericola aurantiacus TaxID=3377839 RepID=UPI00383B3C25
MARDDAGTTPGAELEAPAPNPFRRVWWLPVVRGIAFVVLGLLLMIEPLGELAVLRLVIGAFLVLDAVLVLVQWLAHRRQVGSAWWLAQAAVNVLFGAAVAFWPDLSETPLYYVLASWTIVLGIVAVVGGVALARNRDLGWPWMVTFGIVAALFGVLLVTRPLDSLDVLRLVAIVFALFAFVAGSIHLVSGFAVRSVARELADLREQAEKVGVVVTGGSVLGAANPQAAPARASAADAVGPRTGVEGIAHPPAVAPPASTTTPVAPDDHPDEARPGPSTEAGPEPSTDAGTGSRPGRPSGPDEP